MLNAEEMAIQDGLLRALCFHDAWGYPPTLIELVSSWDGGSSVKVYSSFTQVEQFLRTFIKEGRVRYLRGRVVFPDREDLVWEHEKREAFFARKLRRINLVAKWLIRLEGVRFVAVCNTTALGHARDEGDLDFFVITKSGSLWQTRGFSALPFKMLGLRPSVRDNERDAVCLSFFVDDQALDLSLLQLSQDDPYFRHWFLSLLPIVDDGIGAELWKANTQITSRHPFATSWILHPEIGLDLPFTRLSFFSALESLAYAWQKRALPLSIQCVANLSTDVVVNEHVLKMHVTDNRVSYRQTYYEHCQRYGLEP